DEVAVTVLVVARAAGLDGTKGRPSVEPDDDAVLSTKDLETDVVPERIVPRTRNDPEGASAEAKNGDGGVEVAVLLEPSRLDCPAVRIHLDDVLSGHEADRVEVVNGEVAEHAAGGGDVLAGRRRRVVRRRAHGQDAAGGS